MHRRRAFLAAGAGLTVGGATWAWFRQEAGLDERPRVAEPPAVPVPLKRAFDARATDTLARLYALLLPGGGALPSALDAGVLSYVEQAGRVAGLRPLRDEVLKLSRHLDRIAEPLRFAETDDARATQLTLEVQADDAPRGRFIPSRGLEAALRLGLEGYLGHPHHGGNEAFKAWDALNIRMPRERVALGHHHQGGQR